jgi:hypothetical protein
LAFIDGVGQTFGFAGGSRRSLRELGRPWADGASPEMLKRLCCFGKRGDGVAVEREVVTGGLVGNEYFVAACAP